MAILHGTLLATLRAFQVLSLHCLSGLHDISRLLALLVCCNVVWRECDFGRWSGKHGEAVYVAADNETAGMSSRSIDLLSHTDVKSRPRLR